MKFTEAQLEHNAISLHGQQGNPHTSGLKIYLQLTMTKFGTLTNFKITSESKERKVYF